MVGPSVGPGGGPELATAGGPIVSASICSIIDNPAPAVVSPV